MLSTVMHRLSLTGGRILRGGGGRGGCQHKFLLLHALKLNPRLVMIACMYSL